jgi:putative membrane protein
VSRWAERLRAEGTEPDPRFTFANERTFLAWIRTSLALIAGGIGLEAFVPSLGVPGLRQVLACGLVVLGVLLSATSFARWQRAERAIRTGRPLPMPALAPALAFGVAAVGLVAVIMLLVVRA